MIFKKLKFELIIWGILCCGVLVDFEGQFYNCKTTFICENRQKHFMFNKIL